MIRTLEFEDNIIGGEIMRDIVDIFPQLEAQFTQRKSFDEFYFTPTQVELTLATLQGLNELDFVIKLNHNSIVIIE